MENPQEPQQPLLVLSLCCSWVGFVSKKQEIYSLSILTLFDFLIYAVSEKEEKNAETRRRRVQEAAGRG